MNSSHCWEILGEDCQQLLSNNYDCIIRQPDNPACLMTWGTCQDYCRSDNHLDAQERLNAPMPWIGMYIAAACGVCTVLMAADAFKGFKIKKLWFPCKYFSLNATSLTLLAVAMKFSMDISNLKAGDNDNIASLSSVVLMTTAITNFMTSVASMDGNGLILNLTALAILVITIVVNVRLYSVEYIDTVDSFVPLTVVCLLLSLILLCSSAAMVTTTRKYLDSKLHEMHKMVSMERGVDEKYNVHELKTVLKKYWVMAQTGNPQFVMARSVISVIPGLICLLLVSILSRAYIVTAGPYIWYPQYRQYAHLFFRSLTSYKWSVNWILFAQTAGVVIGSVAPISRGLIATKFRSSMIGHNSFKDEFKMETHWTGALLDWRERPIPLQIRNIRCKKLLHVSKRLLLNVCIAIQILIILASKLVFILCAWCVDLARKFFHHIKKLKRCALRSSSDKIELESELDFSQYVLLLEGEFELPKQIIMNMCSEADKLIQVGKLQEPRNILKLLHKCENFMGVKQFDSKEVESLHTREPPNCWSLPVVTLTRIAVACCSVSNSCNQLLSGVSEGLSFVKLIEKAFDTNGEVTRIQKAADIVWIDLELFQDRTCKHTLQELSDRARKTVMDFKSNVSDLIMENPLNWPAKVIAANSMYRICQSILLIENGCTEGRIDEDRFERLSVIIADILAACLTNLVRVIVMKCAAMEKREASIRDAAVLVGESEEIIQFLEKLECPKLDPDKAGYIDAWRTILEENEEVPISSVKNSESSSGHVSIEMEN